jgi:hypothetical protein
MDDVELWFEYPLIDSLETRWRECKPGRAISAACASNEGCSHRSASNVGEATEEAGWEETSEGICEDTCEDTCEED